MWSGREIWAAVSRWFLEFWRRREGSKLATVPLPHDHGATTILDVCGLARRHAFSDEARRWRSYSRRTPTSFTPPAGRMPLGALATERRPSARRSAHGEPTQPCVSALSGQHRTAARMGKAVAKVRARRDIGPFVSCTCPTLSLSSVLSPRPASLFLKFLLPPSPASCDQTLFMYGSLGRSYRKPHFVLQVNSEVFLRHGCQANAWMSLRRFLPAAHGVSLPGSNHRSIPSL